MFQIETAQALPLVFRESVGVSLVLHITAVLCCAVRNSDLGYGVHVHVQLPMTAHGWHDDVLLLRRWPCLNMHFRWIYNDELMTRVRRDR